MKKKTCKKLQLVYLLSILPSLLFAQHAQLNTLLSKAVEGKKATVGIAVIIDAKDTITLNNEIHYPMMSVYKFHQALALANYMDKHNLPLENRLSITQSDMKPDTYSPLREKYPRGGIDMSIADLLKYTLQQSDNNACDILFRYQGGTTAVNEYIHSLGIQDCSIVATEEEMHQEPERCYLNWSTPLAAACLIENFLNQPLFADTYKTFIYHTMVECQTGKDRLPAPILNKEIIIGHKTGTGGPNTKGQITGVNDIGFIFLPNGHTYSIAVFVKDSEESLQASSEIIADISRIVYEYITEQTAD